MKLLFIFIICWISVVPAKITDKNSGNDQLLEKAKNSHSDALIVMQNGKVVFKYLPGSPDEKIETMSVTKSIVALAVAKLLSDGKIDSLNTPVYKFYPEWKQGKKQLITVRELMNHTSGLQNVPITTKEIYPSKDFIQLALCAGLSNDPGTHFAYNNKAVNLLAGIINKASGQQMDVYLENNLFKDMGITDITWQKDPAGNPEAMAGFEVKPMDLLKLGELVLNHGQWKGKQLISKNWIDSLTVQSQPLTKTCGLLWWRIPESVKYIIDNEQIEKIKSLNPDEELLNKVNKLKGTYNSKADYIKAVLKVLGQNAAMTLNKVLGNSDVQLARTDYGKFIGYEANGYLGQYIVVIPSEKLVAVRMIKYFKQYNPNQDGFADFPEYIYNLYKN